MTTFTLLLVGAEAAMFEHGDKGWRFKQLYSQSRNPAADTPAAVRILQELNADLNLGKKLADTSMHIVCDQTIFQTASVKLPETLSQLNCTDFHFSAWEEIAERARSVRKPQHEPAHHDNDWLLNIFLPVANGSSHTDHSQALAEQAELRKEQEENLAALQAERDRLQQEIIVLKQQAQSVGQLDIEQLSTYLPIIYRNFWSSVKPSDLALIAGSYNIPNIPSPFPEPSNDTVALMKKRLQALPASEYQKIADLCRELPHQLEVRPEMRFVLEN